MVPESGRSPIVVHFVQGSFIAFEAAVEGGVISQS
jgi:hypothetical protein